MAEALLKRAHKTQPAPHHSAIKLTLISPRRGIGIANALNDLAIGAVVLLHILPGKLHDMPFDIALVRYGKIRIIGETTPTEQTLPAAKKRPYLMNKAVNDD